MPLCQQWDKSAEMSLMKLSQSPWEYFGLFTTLGLFLWFVIIAYYKSTQFWLEARRKHLAKHAHGFVHVKHIFGKIHSSKVSSPNQCHLQTSKPTWTVAGYSGLFQKLKFLLHPHLRYQIAKTAHLYHFVGIQSAVRESVLCWEDWQIDCNFVFTTLCFCYYCLKVGKATAALSEIPSSSRTKIFRVVFWVSTARLLIPVLTFATLQAVAGGACVSFFHGCSAK